MGDGKQKNKENAVVSLLVLVVMAVALWAFVYFAKQKDIVVEPVPKDPVVVEDHTGHDHGEEEHVDAPDPMQNKVAAMSWKVPENWTEVDPNSNMIIKRFVIKNKDVGSVDLQVTRFNGDVGGFFANVNRWRRKLNLPSVADAASLSEHYVTITPAGREMMVFDQSSKKMPDVDAPAIRLLVVTYPTETNTWFFKAIGNQESIEMMKKDLLGALESLSIKGE